MSKSLSYDKFLSLLSKKMYIPVLIYYVQKDDNAQRIIFFEVRLPKTQKSVLIYVPPTKFKMLLPQNSNIKKIKITKLKNKSSLSENSINYLIQSRGPLIEADLTAVSSDGLCYSKLSGENECYFFDSSMVPIEIIEKRKKEKRDMLKELEKDVKRVAQKMEVKLKPHKIVEVEKNAEDVEEEENSEENEGVELIFSDEIQKEIEQKEKGEYVEVQEESVDFSNDSFSSEEEFSNDENFIKSPYRTNYVFPEELDVNMGIVYVTLDINIFYKQVSEYEKEALSVYEQLDDNEIDMRISRANDIKKKLGELASVLDAKIKEIELEEKGLKYQLMRLTNILTDAETIRSKSSELKNGVKEVSTDVDRVYNQTRKTVHDLNVELIRRKEDIEEIMTNYEESINDLTFL